MENIGTMESDNLPKSQKIFKFHLIEKSYSQISLNCTLPSHQINIITVFHQVYVEKEIA